MYENNILSPGVALSARMIIEDLSWLNVYDKGLLQGGEKIYVERTIYHVYKDLYKITKYETLKIELDKLAKESSEILGCNEEDIDELFKDKFIFTRNTKCNARSLNELVQIYGEPKFKEIRDFLNLMAHPISINKKNFAALEQKLNKNILEILSVVDKKMQVDDKDLIFVKSYQKKYLTTGKIKSNIAEIKKAFRSAFPSQAEEDYLTPLFSMVEKKFIDFVICEEIGMMEQVTTKGKAMFEYLAMIYSLYWDHYSETISFDFVFNSISVYKMCSYMNMYCTSPKEVLNVILKYYEDCGIEISNPREFKKNLLTYNLYFLSFDTEFTYTALVERVIKNVFSSNYIDIAKSTYEYCLRKDHSNEFCEKIQNSNPTMGYQIILSGWAFLLTVIDFLFSEDTSYSTLHNFCVDKMNYYQSLEKKVHEDFVKWINNAK